MKSLSFIKAVTVIATTVLIVGGVFFLSIGLFVFVVNADLYGRLTETQTSSGVGNPHDSSFKTPKVRVVLHRLLADENAIEVSVLLVVEDSDLVSQIGEGKANVSAILRDASLYQPYGIRHDVTLDKATARLEPGVNSVAVQSERFLLPVTPSVGGFPFDDIEVRPFVEVLHDGYSTQDFRLEIQKAFPGRLMYLSDDNIVTIRLTRSPTEKALVITSSLVFLLLSVILAFRLFATPCGLTTLEELFAVAGYLIAAASFRELLGVSRVAGTSALEITIMGVPLVLLAFGTAVSFFRGIRYEHQRKPTSVGSSPQIITQSPSEPLREELSKTTKSDLGTKA